MHGIYLTIVLAPLLASIVAGLFGKVIGRAGAHWITITAVAVSFLLSLVVFILLVVFCFQAFQALKRGRHYFQEHVGLTYGFLALWMVSVVSGEILYVVRYLD